MLQCLQQQRSSARRGPHAETVRHFRATQQQPMWLLAAGAGCAALFLGSRYVVRAQERMRRKREGLPVDDNDDESAYRETPAARMTHILGVDYGTSNLRLSVASLESAQPSAVRVIESADGLRAIPAAVAVDNDSVSVGVLAKALLGRKPGYTALATRLLLERDASSDAATSAAEWDRLVAALPYKITSGANGEALTLELDRQTYSPEWAAEMLLDHVHSMAARSLGHDSIDSFPAVLSVPAGLSPAKRSAFERVAESAGFAVVAAIDEPVAALHAAEVAASDDNDTDALRALTAPNATVAVFDMGGYQSSLSVLSRRGASYDVVASRATSLVSGTTVDDALVRRVMAKFERETGIDLAIDPFARYRVREAVETAKIELSSRRSTDVNLPFITADRTGAKHLVQQLSAFDLARACELQTRDVTALCDAALHAAGRSIKDVDALVLVGGGVRSAPMRTQLEQYFGRAAFQSRGFAAEEAVVVGAAAFGRRLATE